MSTYEPELLACPHCGRTDGLLAETPIQATAREGQASPLLQVTGAPEPDCLVCGNCGVDTKAHRLVAPKDAL